VPPSWARAFKARAFLSNNRRQLLANRVRERDVRHDAAPEKGVFQGFLVRSRNWSTSTTLHGLNRACNDPTALTLMIHWTPSFSCRKCWRDGSVHRAGAMPASVARQKDDFAPAQLAGEKIIRKARRRVF